MTTVSTITTFSLPAGQVAIFERGGKGTANVDPTGRANVYTIGEQEAFLGPYDKAVSIVVTPSSPVSYRIDDDQDMADQSGSLKDAIRLTSDGLQIGGAAPTSAQRASVRAGISLQRQPLAQVLTAAYSGAPTVTDLATATSGIASAVRVTKDNACFDYLGPALAPWTPVPDYIAINGSGLSDLANTMSVTFCTDAPVFELFMMRYNTRLFIEVDGEPAMASQLALDAAGAANLVEVDFSGVRKARTIRISGFNMPFGGLYIGPADSVWRATDERPLMTVVGDSYTFGTGASAQALGWAATAARLLNMQYWLDGVGSTGYNSTTPNTLAERYAARHAQLVRRNGGVNSAVTPDRLVWALGYNDGPSAAPAAGTIESGFDAGYAAFSKKPDFVIGPWTPVGVTAGLTDIGTRLAAKAASVGVEFIGIADWVNSANESILTGSDNEHPEQVGHDFLGFRIAQALRSAGM